MDRRSKKTVPLTLPKFALNLPERHDALSAKEFVEQVKAANPGHKLSAVIAAISQAAEIARGTLHNHVQYGRPVRDTTAKRLRDWSGGWVSAAKTLELE